MITYATHKDTGKKMRVLSTTKTIKGPSSGYSTLEHFFATLIVPKGGMELDDKLDRFFNRIV